MTGVTLRPALLYGLLVVILCFTHPVRADETSEARQTEITFKRLAIAPILVGHRQPNMNVALDDTLSCPIDQICADDSAIQPDAGLRMLKMIQIAMERRFDRHVVPLEEVRAAYTDIRLDGARDTPRVLVERLARSLSADLVMVGTLWRYRDRSTIDGFPDKPASVAFALYLVDPKTGRRLWRSIYDETQAFATSDAKRFTKRIKMGLTWLSANELARHGIKEALRTFPSKIRPVDQAR